METASWEVKIHYSTFRWNSCPACFIFLRSWSTIFVFRLINGGAVTFRNCEWLIRANQVGQLGRHFASFHPCCWMFMKLIDWRYYKKYKSILSSGVIEDSRPQIEFEFSFPLLLSSLHRSTTSRFQYRQTQLSEALSAPSAVSAFQRILISKARRFSCFTFQAALVAAESDSGSSGC